MRHTMVWAVLGLTACSGGVQDETGEANGSLQAKGPYIRAKVNAHRDLVRRIHVGSEDYHATVFVTNVQPSSGYGTFYGVGAIFFGAAPTPCSKIPVGAYCAFTQCGNGGYYGDLTLSGGEVTVEGLGAPVSLLPTSGYWNYEYYQEFPDAQIAPGTVMTARIAGSEEIPKAFGNMVMPGNLVVTAPPAPSLYDNVGPDLPVDTSKDLKVEWTAEASAVDSTVRASVYQFNENGAMAVDCNFPSKAGQGFIPSSALRLMPKGHNALQILSEQLVVFRRGNTVFQLDATNLGDGELFGRIDLQ